MNLNTDTNYCKISLQTWDGRDPYEQASGTTTGQLWWQAIPNPIERLKNLSSSQTGFLETHTQLEERHLVQETKESSSLEQLSKPEAFEIIVEYFDQLHRIMILNLAHAIENERQSALQALVFIIKKTGSTFNGNIFNFLPTVGLEVLANTATAHSLVYAALTKYLVQWKAAIEDENAKNQHPVLQTLEEQLEHYALEKGFSNNLQTVIKRLLNCPAWIRKIAKDDGEFLGYTLASMFQKALFEYQTTLAEALQASLYTSTILQSYAEDVERTVFSILQSYLEPANAALESYWEDMDMPPSSVSQGYPDDSNVVETVCKKLIPKIQSVYGTFEDLINPQVKTQLASGYAAIILQSIEKNFIKLFPSTYKNLMRDLIDRLCTECNQYFNQYIDLHLDQLPYGSYHQYPAYRELMPKSTTSFADFNALKQNSLEQFNLYKGQQRTRLTQMKDPFSPQLIFELLGMQQETQNV